MDVASFASKLKTVCLHGHVLTNPYSGRLVYVPCGICDACLAAKATKNEMRVYAQDSLSKYSYFVTLTYDAQTVPRYKISLSSVGENLNVYHCTAVPRVPVYRSVKVHKRVLASKKKAKRVRVSGLSSFTFDDFTFCARPDYVENYCKQSDLSFVKGKVKYPQFSDSYPWLNWKDVSLFIKRFRKQVFKRLGCYEQIHLYVVGEYGPTTFRPHFHILFFFDSDRLASCFGRIASSCWKLGIVDYSASRGKAESYVAGYLNSFSSLPAHIRENRQLRSRGRFSVRFGDDFFRSRLSEAHEGNFSAFINGVDVSCAGRPRKVFAWRSVIDSCFFRFANRDLSDKFTLSRVIFSCCNVFRRPAFRRLKNYSRARELFRYLYLRMSPTARARFLDNDHIISYLFQYLHLPIVSCPSDKFERSFISRFYVLFRAVDVFLKGNGFDPLEVIDRPFRLWQCLQNSIDFYKTRDYENLRNSFQNCSSFESPYSYIFVRQTEAYNEEILKSEVGLLSRKYLSDYVWLKTKHRKLNEMNIPFLNSY